MIQDLEVDELERERQAFIADLRQRILVDHYAIQRWKPAPCPPREEYQ